MSRKLVKNFSIALLSIIFTLPLCEGILLLAGYQPWRQKISLANEPVTMEFDPVLGWRNRTGTYTLPPYSQDGKTVTLTLLERGQRRTRNGPTTADEQLVFIGGSYTQGWALDDKETFPWKVQEQFPEFDVINYGTGGYGTYQSLLKLEQEFSHLSSPRRIIYGFISFHEVRNSAAGYWLRQLAEFSRRGHIELPYATVSDDSVLERHPPERYIALPFREKLALVAFIERVYMKLKTMDRFNQRRQITEQIMLEMKKKANLHGAPLSVAILTSSHAERAHYLNFFKQHDIHGIDCVMECTDCMYGLPRKMMIPGEGHPNAELNSYWASCISQSIKENLSQP